MIVIRASPQATLITSTQTMQLPEDKQKILDQFIADAEQDWKDLRESREMGRSLIDQLQSKIEEVIGPSPEKVFSDSKIQK